MNTAFLILLISAATLTASVGNAAPQSAELARLILQALEMNKASMEQSDIISAVSRLQEEEQNAANNPYKNFKPPEDHKLPSNGEQGATGNGQFFLPPPVFPIVPITVTSYGGTLVSVEKIIKPEGERMHVILADIYVTKLSFHACFAGDEFCYRDQTIQIPLPICNPGFWYNCIVAEFTPGLGDKIQVCDMGFWPGLYATEITISFQTADMYLSGSVLLVCPYKLICRLSISVFSRILQ